MKAVPGRDRMDPSREVEAEPESNFFFFNDPPPPEIYTLPLHDALRICSRTCGGASTSGATGRAKASGSRASRRCCFCVSRSRFTGRVFALPRGARTKQSPPVRIGQQIGRAHV